MYNPETPSEPSQHIRSSIAKNIVISPNSLVWKFCDEMFSGEITVFFAVKLFTKIAIG